MPLSAIPNLAQLQAYRKTGRFDPTLKGKQDVMKSDSRIVGLTLNGEFMGFGQLEPATPEEIAWGRGNAIFDDSPLLPDWQPEIQPIGVSEVVQKSADVSDSTAPDVLESIFPPCLRNN